MDLLPSVSGRGATLLPPSRLQRGSCARPSMQRSRSSPVSASRTQPCSQLPTQHLQPQPRLPSLQHPRTGHSSRSVAASATRISQAKLAQLRDPSRSTINPILVDKFDSPEEVMQNSMREISRTVAKPNFKDPQWSEKVDDWWDFWNYESWDQAVLDLDDAEDAENPPESGHDRAHRLINAIQSVGLRGDVTNWLPVMHERDHDDLWEFPPVTPEREDPAPPQSMSDVRAIAEKRRRKATMDAEWRRRKETVGRFIYKTPSVYNDVRLKKFANEYEKPAWQWTDKDVDDLITLNGLNCPPGDHAGTSENPLLKSDYVWHGVKYIDETEEYLQEIGHFATPDMLQRFEQEFELDAEDGDDDEEEEEEDGEEDDSFDDDEEEGEEEYEEEGAAAPAPRGDDEYSGAAGGGGAEDDAISRGFA